LISIDDFNPNNIKLANLIKKYDLQKDTWFAIQLNDVDSYRQIETLYSMGFNIASHTVSHAFLTEIPIEDAYYEIKDSKDILDELTGKNTDWLVLPRGRGNEAIYEIAIKLGHKYIRTTKIHNEDFYGNESIFKKVKGGNHLSYPRKEYNGTDPFEWAKKSELKHYWFHMFELLKYDKMRELEEFLIWYKEKK